MHAFKTSRLLRALIIAIVLMVLVTMICLGNSQQSQTTQYVYDNNGRLHIVIYPTGEKTVYEYDAAGNITSITNLGVAPTLQSFSPMSGTAGDPVTFTGIFGTGTIVVAFNGVNAQIVSATATEIVATVPDTATTGVVTITNPTGTVQTNQPFTVVAQIHINPASVTLNNNQIQQFTAVVTSLAGDQSVSWSVNGIPGGDATVGTITASGLYTAPDNLMNNTIVRATSVAMPTVFGEAQISKFSGS